MNFDWNNLAGNLQPNAFNEKKTYDNNVDTRFWKLSRDEAGNGGALIRFLPDANEVMFVTLERINARRAQKGYFVSEWSPKSIGLPCPFNEKFSELWNKGEKDTAKLLGRSTRYITNIKVIKDPANPDNEGKIFLYDMSHTMMEMLKNVMIKTDAMEALGEEPVQVFNPLDGQNFLLKAKIGTNKIVTYSDSKFADKVTSIYGDMSEAEADIKANAFELKEFLEPANFKSVEELNDMMEKFLKIGKYADGAEPEAQTAPATQVTPTAQATPVQVAPVAAAAATAVVAETTQAAPVTEAPATVDDDLDSLLSELD